MVIKVLIYMILKYRFTFTDNEDKLNAYERYVILGSFWGKTSIAGRKGLHSGFIIIMYFFFCLDWISIKYKFRKKIRQSIPVFASFKMH